MKRVFSGITSQLTHLFTKVFGRKSDKEKREPVREGMGDTNEVSLDELCYLKWDKNGTLVPCSRQETNLDYKAVISSDGASITYVPYPSNYSEYQPKGSQCSVTKQPEHTERIIKDSLILLLSQKAD